MVLGKLLVLLAIWLKYKADILTTDWLGLAVGRGKSNRVATLTEKKETQEKHGIL